ncbi:hypothetical protein K488DRAFT_75403 [Vararia minispora EC-137]|uniref:Uncharacterized protein n=1 Tax=Vararia minispora EC-137 TaxID=1314806 RepID=A0ACB8Q3W8_9AGAM|nr:hypothetical protein K488DRAFT_75403 [Vararia minispora EC-137]
MVNLHAPLPFNLHNAVLSRSASRVSTQPSLDDDEASQSTSSLSVPADAPDAEPDEPRAPLSVRLVRAAPALRGRSSTRRISPTTLAKRDDTGSASGSGSGSAADTRVAGEYLGLGEQSLHLTACVGLVSALSSPPSLDDDEASQSTSSLSVPADAPDAEPDEPRTPLSVRLVRAAPALRGRSSTRRISPTTLAKCDDTGSTSGSGSGSAADTRVAGSTPQAQPGPLTARALTIQLVGSFSRSWGD